MVAANYTCYGLLGLWTLGSVCWLVLLGFLQCVASPFSESRWLDSKAMHNKKASCFLNGENGGFSSVFA